MSTPGDGKTEYLYKGVSKRNSTQKTPQTGTPWNVMYRIQCREYHKGIQQGEYSRLLQDTDEPNEYTRGIPQGIKETVPDGYNKGYNAGEFIVV